MDQFPSKESPEIQYRKLFLTGYLQKLCSDPGKFEYWEYLDKVGKMHCTRRLHVDYVHLGMTMGLLQDILFEEILLHSRLKTERKAALIKALGKVLWIQNDAFSRYHLAGEENMRRAVLTPTSEKEGWLHGKQMLNLDASASSGTEEGFSSPAASSIGTPAEELGRCPFTTMTEQLGQLNVHAHHGPS